MGMYQGWKEYIFSITPFYVSVAEGADAHSEQVVDNRNDRYREYSLLSRELLFVQVEPDAPIGIVDKMEKSREWNPVQLNYLELALPRKLCL